ncbi:GIY-YIG nuclease family protein [Alteromonas sediminis]|uniref:GIY-YIG nuclease family protein n=1 Tax=Alteromonas sediminis TaxID=2259342 RepID=A0A3N5Z5U4_9ALTE|nr:GIY-YIG nuclease family protein [Alteromonas sediminis]RPJ65744.1 GIY-YIG nuclease family protein [Alteromonas sediminis]
MSIPAITTQQPQCLPWFIYIIETRHGELYTGITTDVNRRMAQHRGERKGGAKYLRNKGPFTTRQLWQTVNRSSATQAELWIKSQSKKNKLALLDEPASMPFEDVFVCERLSDSVLLRE